jgi:hypothetical protein
LSHPDDRPVDPAGSDSAGVAPGAGVNSHVSLGTAVFNGMMEVIRLLAGKDWQPDLVSMRSSMALPPLASEHFPDTRFPTAQPCTFMTFPKTLLNLSLDEYGAHVMSRIGSKSKHRIPLVPAEDLAGSLKQLIQSYLSSGYPSIALAAEAMGIDS